MIRLSKSVLAVGGVVLALGLIAFTNPKTVHALAAALVEVTNTASNPVVTQSTTQQAAQIVQLTCNGNSGPCTYVLGNAFTVPLGKSFVLTSIDITASNTPSNILCPIAADAFLHWNTEDASDTGVYSWVVPANSGTVHLTYPSGLVFAPTATLHTDNAFCNVSMLLSGYLTMS
jgi:hypothetical protein